MPVSRQGIAARLACCLVIALVCRVPQAAAVADTLPDRLTDAEFWELSDRLSEPDGYFRSDNLLSNELHYPEVLDRLIARGSPAGVYLGVGPEQNFSYIAAIRPRMVFITDVRRGNLHLHLMYKALFELSADRADFISRLFTKPRPPTLPAHASAVDIMDAYWVTDTLARNAFDRNLRAVHEHLTTTRALPLGTADLEGIADVYFAFYWFGPSITYSSSSNNGFGRGNSMATYYQLMVAQDSRGLVRSFLASEESFAAVKGLHARNLIVPVVGDFGGQRALRGIGAWVREHGATVSTFYLSNVEQYLRQQGTWSIFCANVASMPLSAASTFVRSQSGGGGFRNMLGEMDTETRPCLPRSTPSETMPAATAVP
jgi:hypothetical protein